MRVMVMQTCGAVVSGTRSLAPHNCSSSALKAKVTSHGVVPDILEACEDLPTGMPIVHVDTSYAKLAPKSGTQ
ncbi:hypothetical protein BWQ96_03338 [Gracilariopsis chorda]|uniref:Uncharacterized protein n=1 Tax=Gracilariopsis chorda TaxID=448386 RepID=A0A2V3IXI0_9FLOR|nr:hypothetical protein BWQ96_03338 [Gracilariopsis chorda]|eukprot:PXF46809.1 hypothetical protein BWQ96_03338 [Gracilariopsis chorda]